MSCSQWVIIGSFLGSICDELKRRAKSSDAAAQFDLGTRYHTGQGVPRDAKKAARLFSQAAAQGLAEALFCLGTMYRNGEGVPKDTKEAVRLFEQAAVQGHARAYCSLGMMHHTGEGVPNDARKAAWYFEQAAALGYAKAQYNLGVMYAKGERMLKHDSSGIAPDAGAPTPAQAKACLINFKSDDAPAPSRHQLHEAFRAAGLDETALVLSGRHEDEHGRQFVTLMFNRVDVARKFGAATTHPDTWEVRYLGEHHGNHEEYDHEHEKAVRLYELVTAAPSA